jgi:alpha-L-fucosidase 2
MKRSITLGTLVLFLLASALFHESVIAETSTQNNNFRLWYTEPAANWMEALPLGNGSLGAMVYGGVYKEQLQINEDTLWSGYPNNNDNPEAFKYLPEIRKLIFDGENYKAQQVADSHFYGIPSKQTAYQTFGDIHLDFQHRGEASGYQRELDLEEGVVRVRYRIGDVTFTREYFSSYPDRIIVMRLSCDTKGMLSFDASLSSLQKGTSCIVSGENQLSLLGLMLKRKAPPPDPTNTQVNQWVADMDKDGLKFEGGLYINNEGGTVTAGDGEISVRNADEAVLLFAAATSYINYNDISGDPHQHVTNVINSAKRKSYKALINAHSEDYKKLYNTVNIDLGMTEAGKQPTDERIKNYKPGNDPGYEALCYQYGRYLLIASSRPGSQTANLQGIWNDSLWPPWSSKYTININIQMNYWPAEISGLSECFEPFYNLLSDLSKTGNRTAKTHYGANGWVAHHNTDLWRNTAPVDLARYGMWPGGSGWMCLNLWEHYLFTRDKQYLKDIYPIIKGAAEFYSDTLIKHPEYDWLVNSPSMSPEHVFKSDPTSQDVSLSVSNCAGPTIDMQIMRGIFSHCIEAAGILGIDKEFSEMLAEKSARLAPMQVGKWGQLQEYLEDIDDPHDTHSHVSHLYGLYPGDEITNAQTPDIFDAARTSLIHRGDSGGGWPGVWRGCLWARVGDGEHAYSLVSSAIGAGRFSPNLFNGSMQENNEARFQIDANFGYTAAVAEMLLQSHESDIRLLPALPGAWNTGYVEGLRARGGFAVDMYWENGIITKAIIHSLNGNKCTVRHNNSTVTFSTVKGNEYILDSDLKLIYQ